MLCSPPPPCSRNVEEIEIVVGDLSVYPVTFWVRTLWRSLCRAVHARHEQRKECHRSRAMLRPLGRSFPAMKCVIAKMVLAPDVGPQD